jgi:O-antigen ligase
MNIENLQKPTIYIATLLGLLGAVLLGKYVGEGNSMQIMLLLGGLAGVTFMLALGKNYWMVLLFAFASGIPALPMGGRTVELGELGAFVCFAIYLAMLALHRTKLRLLNIETIAVLLFISWVGFIYSQNPVGMAFLGSQDIGVRDYIKIVCGLLAFIVISNQIITENDCKWLIWIMIVGSIVALVWGIIDDKLLGAGGFENEDSQYTWQQGLSRPSFVIILYLFCRYGAKRVLSIMHPVLFLAFFAFFVIALLSGKRAVVASIMLTPFFAALLRKQRAQAFVYVAVGVIGIGILVMGHGSIFHLPYTVQRSLANLPGDWDTDITYITEGGSDEFRTGMRELAWEKINRNPIVGVGIGMSRNDLANITSENAMQNISISLAAGSSWHNTWLGLWADFGLPAVILHAVILILCLRASWKAFRGSNTNGTYPTAFNVLAMMTFFELSFGVLRSYTSGSSNIPYSLWWEFGLVVALVRSLGAHELWANPNGKLMKTFPTEKQAINNLARSAQL